MKLQETKLQGKGTVHRSLIDNKTGKVILDAVDHNLIVKIGRSTLIKLLAGDSVLKVTKMSIGKGGTADTGLNAFNPIAPTDSDTALRIHVQTINIASKTVDVSKTNPQVTFVALFDCATVDSLVNECGLVFSDATTLFARHTFDTVSLKATSDFSLQISWTIEF